MATKFVIFQAQPLIRTRPRGCSDSRQVNVDIACMDVCMYVGG